MCNTCSVVLCLLRMGLWFSCFLTASLQNVMVTYDKKNVTPSLLQFFMPEAVGLIRVFSCFRYLFQILSYLIGVFVFATIVGQVGNSINNNNATRHEYEQLLVCYQLFSLSLCIVTLASDNTIFLREIEKTQGCRPLPIAACTNLAPNILTSYSVSEI